MVSSNSHRHAEAAQVSIGCRFARENFRPMIAYGQAKLCNVLMANELTRRWGSEGITGNSLHPGTLMLTSIGGARWYGAAGAHCCTPLRQNPGPGRCDERLLRHCSGARGRGRPILRRLQGHARERGGHEPFRSRATVGTERRMDFRALGRYVPDGCPGSSASGSEFGCSSRSGSWFPTSRGTTWRCCACSGRTAGAGATRSRILRHGVCDGCSLGPRGLRDDVIPGVHLCLTRLKLLRLNTMGPIPDAALGDVEALRALGNEGLHRLGRVPYPLLRRAGERGIFAHFAGTKRSSWSAGAMRKADPDAMGMFVTSRGLTNETYYVLQKLARVAGTPHIDSCARLCHAASTDRAERDASASPRPRFRCPTGSGPIC